MPAKVTLVSCSHAFGPMQTFQPVPIEPPTTAPHFVRHSACVGKA